MKKVIKKTDFALVFYIVLLLNVWSCTSVNSPTYIPSSTQAVIKQAEQQGFVFKKYPSSLVTYAVWEKMQSPHTTIHVYLEGDGNSWKTKYELSENPTPRKALSLQLALRDRHENVIYLARPCQYINDINCDSAYWSHARYSTAVVQSITEVLDQIKARYLAKEFLLVGFSGGGNLAALLSAERQDVVGFVTVAGNLNHSVLNEYHQVSPLKDSLNAIDFHVQLRKIPQRHFIGDNDRIVPPWLIEQYAQVLDSECVSVKVIQGNTHHRGWIEPWPVYLDDVLPCQGKTFDILEN